MSLEELENEEKILRKCYEEFLTDQEDFNEKIFPQLKNYLGTYTHLKKLESDEDGALFSLGGVNTDLESIKKNLETKFEGDFRVTKSNCCIADFEVIYLWKIKTFLFICKECKELERVVWKKVSVGNAMMELRGETY